MCYSSICICIHLIDVSSTDTAPTDRPTSAEEKHEDEATEKSTPDGAVNVTAAGMADVTAEGTTDITAEGAVDATVDGEAKVPAQEADSRGVSAGGQEQKAPAADKEEESEYKDAVPDLSKGELCPPSS